MVKTFTAYEASRTLVLVKEIVEDLREEMEVLILLQSRGNFPTEPEVKKHIEKLKHHFEELKQLGCIAREPQEGVVDFPSFYRGEPVFLCWQLGEEEVLHWHEVGEHHLCRREITNEFLSENSKNSPAVA
jgi:hypothetical protein